MPISMADTMTSVSGASRFQNRTTRETGGAFYTERTATVVISMMFHGNHHKTDLAGELAALRNALFVPCPPASGAGLTLREVRNRATGSNRYSRGCGPIAMS